MFVVIGIALIIVGMCIIKEHTFAGVIMMIFGAAIMNTIASIG